jgi:hypothetical protein
MKDYLDLSPAPVDEPCAMVGSPDYSKRARLECRAFVDQLERTFPDAIAAGVTFRITRNPHDFGEYLEVQACFDDDDEAQTEWAYTIEAELPYFWDDDARIFLAAEGYETVPRTEFWTMTIDPKALAR